MSLSDLDQAQVVFHPQKELISCRNFAGCISPGYKSSLFSITPLPLISIHINSIDDIISRGLMIHLPFINFFLKHAYHTLWHITI